MFEYAFHTNVWLFNYVLSCILFLHKTQFFSLSEWHAQLRSPCFPRFNCVRLFNRLWNFESSIFSSVMLVSFLLNTPIMHQLKGNVGRVFCALIGTFPQPQTRMINLPECCFLPHLSLKLYIHPADPSYLQSYFFVSKSVSKQPINHVSFWIIKCTVFQNNWYFLKRNKMSPSNLSMAQRGQFCISMNQLLQQKTEKEKIDESNESSSTSDVNDAWQFLDTVEQDVTLLDGRLVLVVFGIGSVGLDDTTHFVDSAMETTGGDKTS